MDGKQHTLLFYWHKQGGFVCLPAKEAWRCKAILGQSPRKWLASLPLRHQKHTDYKRREYNLSTNNYKRQS